MCFFMLIILYNVSFLSYGVKANNSNNILFVNKQCFRVGVTAYTYAPKLTERYTNNTIQL
jgi:hypothetical protein